MSKRLKIKPGNKDAHIDKEDVANPVGHFRRKTTLAVLV